MTPRSPRRRLLTLSTDFGPEYSAQVKGVLARSLDPARIVELTSGLPAHGIAEAAFVVRAMARWFPAGTVHLVVVDPGVGSRRAPLAVACADGSRLVGPDNGVLFPLAELLGRPRAFRLDPSRLGLTDRVGTTFDGRDLFAPAAARLADGARPASMGPPIRPTEYRIPEPVRRGAVVVGQVVHVDRFGNVISNLPTDAVRPVEGTLRLRVGRRHIALPWVESYAALGRGRAGALGSSFGTVEIALDEGRAAARFGVRVGDRVEAETSQSVNSVPSRRR